MFESIGQDKEGNEIRLLDIIEQPPLDVVERMELQNNIEKLERYRKECLTDREWKILFLRYGLGGTRELTQSELGEMFGISRSYVSRIEKKALMKLKNCFENDK